MGKHEAVVGRGVPMQLDSAMSERSEDRRGGPQPADHELFLSLVESHRRALLKICWVYGRNSHDRDDLLQEIVGRLWAAFGDFDRDRKFSTWMYRVALNAAIDFGRRRRRWRRETDDLDPAEIPDATTNDPARLGQASALRELLDRQSEADRAMLLLYLEGHSHREMGAVLGMSESNVGTRLHRLKISLRESAQATDNDQGGP